MNAWAKLSELAQTYIAAGVTLWSDKAEASVTHTSDERGVVILPNHSRVYVSGKRAWGRTPEEAIRRLAAKVDLALHAGGTE